MRLIYVGRLDKEKGIISIISLIHEIKSQGNKDITIDIFGKGEYSDTISLLSKELPDIVTYHGRKDKREITGLWSEMDFFIMPSTFLETFGLTACESLMLGVPVIGYKKGGLLPFIDPLLALDDKRDLMNVISDIQHQGRSKKDFKNFVSDIIERYTTEKRQDSMEKILLKDSSILMVSDFINYNGGGVETHIHDAKAILQDHKTTIYGHQAPTGQRARFKKLGLMSLSILNLRDSRNISQISQKKKIKVIRRHSISRVIGRLPLFITSWYNSESTNSSIRHIMTHHELGLFHPFPSQVVDIKQIPAPWSLSSFIKAGKTNNIIQIIAINGKFLLIWLIHKQLQKTIQTHIVPSERLKNVVQSRYPQAHVLVIPHFVNTIDNHLLKD